MSNTEVQPNHMNSITLCTMAFICTFLGLLVLCRAVVFQERKHLVALSTPRDATTCNRAFRTGDVIFFDMTRRWRWKRGVAYVLAFVLQGMCDTLYTHVGVVIDDRDNEFGCGGELYVAEYVAEKGLVLYPLERRLSRFLPSKAILRENMEPCRRIEDLRNFIHLNLNSGPLSSPTGGYVSDLLQRYFITYTGVYNPSNCLDMAVSLLKTGGWWNAPFRPTLPTFNELMVNVPELPCLGPPRVLLD